MNWKVSFGLKYSLFILIGVLSIFLILASILMGFALFDEFQQQRLEALDEKQKEEELQETLIKKELLYQEISPMATKSVITYKINNKPLFQDHIMIGIRDSDSQEEEPIFIGEERTGMPSWLDDEHILFTTYCGTSCKGIYLVDIRDKEVSLATLSFTFSGANSWETHFKDWFGNQFQFPGLLGDIDTEFTNDHFYLVFSKKDQLDSSNKKRFLFTGENLIEHNIEHNFGYN